MEYNGPVMQDPVLQDPEALSIPGSLKLKELSSSEDGPCTS